MSKPSGEQMRFDLPNVTERARSDMVSKPIERQSGSVAQILFQLWRALVLVTADLVQRISTGIRRIGRLGARLEQHQDSAGSPQAALSANTSRFNGTTMGAAICNAFMTMAASKARVACVLGFAFVAGLSTALLARDGTSSPILNLVGNGLSGNGSQPVSVSHLAPPATIQSVPVSYHTLDIETAGGAANRIGDDVSALSQPSTASRFIGAAPSQSAALSGSLGSRPLGSDLTTPPSAPIVAPRPKLSVAPPPQPGSFSVQLAASDSAAGLMRYWQDLQQRVGTVLDDHQPFIAGGRGGDSLARLRVGDFQRKTDAEALCAALKRQHADCFVVTVTM
jgi:cell division septation protein DedD